MATTSVDQAPIRHVTGARSLLDLPDRYVGPVHLPGTGREVWWTGRVAIGLRYERGPDRSVHGRSALWLQDLLLGAPAPHA